jgi:hypothetical protein
MRPLSVSVKFANGRRSQYLDYKDYGKLLINIEQLANWELAEETEVLGENLPPVPLCPPQIHI